jgi:ribosomal protein S18 acetylase RimI-like enzyme
MRSARAKPTINVRKARSSDRAAVFKFCEKTWSWGDYIPRVWDKWLQEKNGRVYVATIDGLPVGMSHVRLDKLHEVWLDGARTDPNYRRMGVATAITRKCLEYAKKRGRKLARLATMSDNVAARAAVRKLGFRPTAEFVEMVTENVTKEPSPYSQWTEEDEMAKVWNYVRSSETYRKSAGLYTVLYRYFSLEKQDLKGFIKQRKAIVHKNRRGETDGLTLIDDATAREWRENTVQTCYVDGGFNAVLSMIGFLKSHCHALGVKKIYGFTCNHRPIITALEKLGFKAPGSIDLVYEMKMWLSSKKKCAPAYS